MHAGRYELPHTYLIVGRERAYCLFMPTDTERFARAALRAHVAGELGASISSRAVLAEVATRIKLAKTSPEQARANEIVIVAARMMVQS